MRGLTNFEHHRQPVIPRWQFYQRMGRALLIWLALTLAGLVVGMTGYIATEGMTATDAFLNAAMILSGMGPVGELHTSAGKIFAGVYAIFSGLVIVIAAGFVLAPIAHRVLHRFHVESSRDE